MDRVFWGQHSVGWAWWVLRLSVVLSVWSKVTLNGKMSLVSQRKPLQLLIFVLRL